MQFILKSGSALFGDFMYDFIYVEMFLNKICRINFIESLYIDVKRSFRCRKYDKMLFRKLYIGSQISHFGNVKCENFRKLRFD